MNTSGYSFSVPVDCANPGQFFACCGLLELAHRLWPNAEGHFSDDRFEISGTPQDASPLILIRRLTEAGLQGALTPEEKAELDELQLLKRRAKKEERPFPEDQESRRKGLGKLLRSGPILIGSPFDLHLNWWETDQEDAQKTRAKKTRRTSIPSSKQADGDNVPKTLAGSMQVYRIAAAALAECEKAFAEPYPFEYACVLRPADEEDDEDEDIEEDEGTVEKAEPFYFDSARASSAHPLDQGFSANKLSVLREGSAQGSGKVKARWVKMESAAYPAVEFLALIGLQRFRPKPVGSRVFAYRTWTVPLPPIVAATAACGALPGVGGEAYRFENAFRTDQRKQKGFLPAIRDSEGETS
ncbi:MAG TPA: hypothetical protein VNO22_16790 [Planctomycetota bacterium]|nr:hypothetical protein [Planctomycetota bacterium]